LIAVSSRIISLPGLILCLLIQPFLAGGLLAQSGRKLSPRQTLGASFKLISATVSGSKRYPQADIVAASGLQIGDSVSEDDFKKATQRLGETGAFGDVQYSFKYSAEGAKLELQVSDAERQVPVKLENFVWFTDAELIAKMHERVPLFRDMLPPTGSLADQVMDALQAILIEHTVPGRVDYLRLGPEDGPVEAFVYSVSGPRIAIHDVEFSGAGPNELPLLKSAARRLQGEEYLRSTIRLQADKELLPIYLARGYLKAALGDPQAKIAQEDPQQTDVDVSFAVSPGPQYKVNEIRLSGCKAFSAEQLRELIHQQPGQPANAIRLADDLDAVKKLYGTRGYMAVSVHSKPEMDDAQSTVTYRIDVEEGDPYRMGELEIHLPDSHIRSLVQARWTLREGDTYDSGYLQRFLDEAFKSLALLREWNVSAHESPDPRDKTVDVTLRFELKSGQ
jgi:outer membrane protein assembly factor BamA